MTELTKANINLNTVSGQLNTPVMKVSQPSANKPLAGQTIGAKPEEKKEAVKIESKPISEAEVRPLTEDEILRDASIIARPLHTPDQLKVKGRNPNYVLRWINFKGMGGGWLSKWQAAGYTFATKEDVLELNGELRVDDNRIIAPPDLVLMKMQATVYYGHIKHNLQRSQEMVSQTGAMVRAKQAAQNRMGGQVSLGITERLNNTEGHGPVADPEGGSVPGFQNNLERDGAAFYIPGVDK